MNNPDLIQAQELAQAFKDAGIEPPESEKLITIDWNTTHAYTCAVYSTDELLEILPEQITVDNERNYFELYKGHGNKYTVHYNLLSIYCNKDPKTALTQLLTWALKNHPDAVRRHLEEK